MALGGHSIYTRIAIRALDDCLISMASELPEEPDLVQELEEAKKEIKQLKDTVYYLQRVVKDMRSVTTRAR